jgi:peptidoglycan/LPS O-acetylase OafA/YrhL
MIQFPGDAHEIIDDFRYLIFVEGISESVKTFFMISGFLQTFSFLSKYGTKPTGKDVLKFIAIRYLKLVPIYASILIFCIYVQKNFGSGPTWHLMDKITE